jgi:hypothetical protein|tara:strand:+ start:248 stop:919 length:672 start_codon:yes stop_codon:yes gene_type:complete
MEQKYKVLFNLINPAFLKSGCKKAVMEFDEAFSIYQEGYYCGHQNSGSPKSFLIPIERELSEYVEEAVGDDTWHEETGSEYYTYEVEINPEFRSVEIFGTYTTYDTEPIEEITIEMEEEPEEFKPIFDYLNDEGSDILEVNVDAGGDSGWIHDTNDDVNGNTIQTSDQMEEVCYRLLNQHPGWEINEGSYAKFTFDPHRNILIFEFAYNTEEQARELISSEKF